MEQQQFRVSFSLSTKLLMSVVTMLLVIIGFLTVATIVVLSEDKRAYTFQSQGTEALLAGREFANISGRSSAALKLLLSNYDPSKPISAAERQAMQGIIDNQSDLVLVRVGKFVPAENRFEAIETIELKDALVTANQKAEDFTIAPEWFPIASPGLLKNSIYMINTSRPGYASRALLLADTKYQSADGSLPMAIGFSPIKDLSKEFRNSRITIANSDGYVLFDSDNSVQFSAGNVTNDPIFQKALKAPVASGAGEFRIGEDRILASYGRPGMDLIVTSRMDWKKAMSATYRLAEKFILLGLICTSAAVIFALIFAKSLTAPLLELYKATKDVAAGQFELNLQPRTRDEIGALGASFGVMSRKIQELIKEKMRAVQIENELALASAVQQTLIPPNRYQDPRIE
ncbi:MAG: hypothetical protein RJB38_9, partial [Pseudomonadota bacterium]